MFSDAIGETGRKWGRWPWNLLGRKVISVVEQYHKDIVASADDRSCAEPLLRVRGYERILGSSFQATKMNAVSDYRHLSVHSI